MSLANLALCGQKGGWVCENAVLSVKLVKKSFIFGYKSACNKIIHNRTIILYCNTLHILYTGKAYKWTKLEVVPTIKRVCGMRGDIWFYMQSVSGLLGWLVQMGYSVDFAGFNRIIQRVCKVVTSDKLLKSVFWKNIVIIQYESFADIYHCWSGENYTLSFPD